MLWVRCLCGPLTPQVGKLAKEWKVELLYRGLKSTDPALEEAQFMKFFQHVRVTCVVCNMYMCVRFKRQYGARSRVVLAQ